MIKAEARQQPSGARAEDRCSRKKAITLCWKCRAAQNLAVLHSIVATCRMHGINPYEYIKDMLIRIQTHPASRIERVDALATATAKRVVAT